MKGSQEATTLVQGIIIWLMLAFGCATIWLCSMAVVYHLQNEKTAMLFRFVWAATAATVIVVALVGSAKLYRARRG